jgi:hypothetical protein
LSPNRRRGSGNLSRGAARPQQFRRGNRIFYVVAEGETEYDYFDHINREYGQDREFFIRTPAAPVRRNGLKPSDVVTEAATVVRDTDIHEVWGLFDHDGRPDIDQVYARAKRRDIKVALSHPAFELWLLLHFQDFSPATQGGSNADIMKKLRNAHPAFADYPDDNKHINLERFKALTEDDRIRMAVTRARRLSSSFITETPSNRDPSTDVYLLVESLGIIPGSAL